jgi:ApbE superfamily uncharacterized protein (UPF0280 family)
MKTIKHIILWFWVAIYTVFSMVGCAVEEITTTSTSKSGLVTVEKRITKKADPAAWALANAVVEGYAPRARVVRQEKSTSDLGRILKGRPITKEEIANRWKP